MANLNAWCLVNPAMTAIIMIVMVLSVSTVIRCLFKALGGGYLPRKHCASCECEQAARQQGKEEIIDDLDA